MVNDGTSALEEAEVEVATVTGRAQALEKEVEELAEGGRRAAATIAELQAALDERDASHRQELEQLRTALTASAEQRVAVRGAMRA